jgi:hypothetical protein
MQMGRSLLFVHDYGDHRLKAFEANTGAWVWSFGRAGSGPGEFRNATQIALGSDAAEAWVVDGGNSAPFPCPGSARRIPMRVSLWSP